MLYQRKLHNNLDLLSFVFYIYWYTYVIWYMWTPTRGCFRIVIETLRGVEESRKCFRMVGGVLVERTVAEILPELLNNCEQLPRAMRALEEQLARKGADINHYIQNHDIRVQRIDKPDADAAAGPEADQPAKPNVLVASAWPAPTTTYTLILLIIYLLDASLHF